MIEAKLYQAAQHLPGPISSFSEIEERASQIKSRRTFGIPRYRIAAAILVCVFLFMGSTVIAATTEVDYSAWAARSNSFNDAQRRAGELGVVLPEALDDIPFYNVTTMYVAPEGTTYLEAINTPVYRWYSVDYGVNEIVRTDHSVTTVINDEFSVSIGSSEGDLWGYVFSLDESGKWAFDDTLPDSYRTLEHNGIIVQIGTTVQYEEENDSNVFAYHHRIIWEDTTSHVIISIHKSFYAEEELADQLPDEMIDFAKEIIELNLPDR